MAASFLLVLYRFEGRFLTQLSLASHLRAMSYPAQEFLSKQTTYMDYGIRNPAPVYPSMAHDA